MNRRSPTLAFLCAPAGLPSSAPAVRRGVSILEVIFAILVASIGLLGAIALFPVALAQARKGLQADAASAAGLSAIHTFDAYGMRQPARWRYQNNVAPTAADFEGQQAFCLDPLFVAENQGAAASVNNLHGHPVHNDRFPSGASANYMRRITLNSGAGNTVLSKLAAQRLFRFDDDLAFERPSDRTLDAVQLYTPNAANRRQYEGRLSWFATLAPRVERMQQQFDDHFILSIVVCQDRLPELALSSTALVSEWNAEIETAGFHSNGEGGGDVTITAHDEDELAELRVGQWIMLAQPLSMGGATTPLCRWYRIVDLEPESYAYPPPSGTEFARDVTLHGQDWPVGDTEVTIVPGAIAVYEKTIRLEY